MKLLTSLNFRRKGIDTAVWLSVSLALILSLVGVIPPRRHGFYCNDSSIQEKYTGDTVSPIMLLSGCVLMPAAIILFIESVHFNVYQKDVCTRKKQLIGCSSHSGFVFGDFFLGFLITLLITDLIKDMIGEKRPHFLDTCKPTTNCSSATENVYVTEYRCTASEFPRWLVHLDNYKSFPSGHASASFYSAVFMILYLRERVSMRLSRFLRLWLQSLFMLWAIGCSLSRIVDKRHHWWDVLGGSVIGIVGGYFCTVFLEQNFVPKKADILSKDETIVLAQRDSTATIISNDNVVSTTRQ